MSEVKGIIEINLAPDLGLALERRAEEAGMSKEDYLIEVLEDYCKRLDPEGSPSLK